MNSLKWFDNISPSFNFISKPTEASKFLNSYTYISHLRKRQNFRITPSYSSKKLRHSLHDLPSELVVIKGNCAPPTPIIRNNMIKAYVVKGNELCQYFKLLEEDKIIKHFLDMDKCCIFADKYLLAIIFAHFKRCNFSLKEYNRTNFFLCLYLAHDVEEDNEDLKYEIFPWILGPYWRNNVSVFLQKKDNIWARMNYRAIVSKKCCEELMSIYPDHSIWLRERAHHHGGAVRSYKKDLNISIPRGPHSSPKICPKCHPGLSNSLHDSAFSSLWDCESFNDSDESGDILLISNQSIKLYDINSKKNSIEKAED